MCFLPVTNVQAYQCTGYYSSYGAVYVSGKCLYLQRESELIQMECDFDQSQIKGTIAQKKRRTALGKKKTGIIYSSQSKQGSFFHHKRRQTATVSSALVFPVKLHTYRSTRIPYNTVAK